MMFQYRHLSRHARVFQHLTGLGLNEFTELSCEMVPLQAAAHRAKLLGRKEPRKRAVGGGGQFELGHQDQLLLTVIWLRRYPTHQTLGYLFGVDATTVGRVLSRVLPLLAHHGRDTMKMPGPGRKRRVSLEGLLEETPGLAVIVDSFEQRVQKPRTKPEKDSGSSSGSEKVNRKVKDSHYSGKKKQHTLKSQVCVDEETGQIVDVSASVPGPTADKKLLEESKVMEKLPPEVGIIGGGNHRRLGVFGNRHLAPAGLGSHAATQTTRPGAARRRQSVQPRVCQTAHWSGTFHRTPATLRSGKPHGQTSSHKSH